MASESIKQIQLIEHKIILRLTKAKEDYVQCACVLLKKKKRFQCQRRNNGKLNETSIIQGPCQLSMRIPEFLIGRYLSSVSIA